MKKLNLIIFLSLGIFLIPVQGLFAQCSSGEIELTMKISTDNWGYEGYWEIVPAGNACGTGTIISGGNNSVGCNGGGAQSVSNGGYGNNTEITVPAACLMQDSSYDLIYIDDWGDGGFGFALLFNGLQTHYLDDGEATNRWTFVASEPLQYDMSLEEIHHPVSYTQQGNLDVEGLLFNFGGETINSIELNYTIDNGAVQSTSITGLSIANFTGEEVPHDIPWVVTTDGIYDLKLWLSNPNGVADMNPSNDTLSLSVEIGPGIPNQLDDFVDNHHIISEISTAFDQLNKPTDLDFHPVYSRMELWVVNKRTENVGGSVVTYYNTGMANQSSQSRVDGNAWHFMSLPTGIAFGENGNFGTSPGVFDANHNGGQPFTGPSLWSSDPAIFAQPSGGNGSHLDMLHESPLCQGIAHEKGNAYWVFDGNMGDIVRYDFREDHGPGNDDHSDGIIHRYSDVPVTKDPNNQVVSHLVLDKPTGWLYVVDHGGKRVFRMDINTGTTSPFPPSFGPFEPLAEYAIKTGYTWEEVVTTGLLKPAGIDVIEDRMIVSDYLTGDIIIYDISTLPAVELDRIKTGSIGIMGVKLGPDGNIYFVNHDQNKVMMARPAGTAIEKDQLTLKASVYPNPNAGENLQIRFPANGSYQVEILNSLGQSIQTTSFQGEDASIAHKLSAGNYLLKITDLNSGELAMQKLVVN